MINWEAIGALGETIGAIGVIATLIFLAFQIRQNSKLLQTQSNQMEQNQKFAIAQALGQSNGQQDAMLTIANDEALSNLFFNGLRSYENLSPIDRMRFALVIGPMIGAVATQAEQQLELRLFEQGIAPDHLVFAVDFLGSVGGKQWWDRYQDRYSPRFRDLVNRELRRPDRTPARS